MRMRMNRYLSIIILSVFSFKMCSCSFFSFCSFIFSNLIFLRRSFPFPWSRTMRFFTTKSWMTFRWLYSVFLIIFSLKVSSSSFCNFFNILALFRFSLSSTEFAKSRMRMESGAVFLISFLSFTFKMSSYLFFFTLNRFLTFSDMRTMEFSTSLTLFSSCSFGSLKMWSTVVNFLAKFQWLRWEDECWKSEQRKQFHGWLVFENYYILISFDITYKINRNQLAI